MLNDIDSKYLLIAFSTLNVNVENILLLTDHFNSIIYIQVKFLSLHI